MSTPYSGSHAELHAEQRPLSRRAGDADAVERRRYALLQAATQIMCGLYGNDEETVESVKLAEELLAIIERREKEAV